VEVWQTSNLRRLRLGDEKKKEEEERRTNHSMKIYIVSLFHRATINQWKISRKARKPLVLSGCFYSDSVSFGFLCHVSRKRTFGKEVPGELCCTEQGFHKPRINTPADERIKYVALVTRASWQENTMMV